MRPNTSLALAVAIALAAWTALSAVVAAHPSRQLFPRPTPPPDRPCSAAITHTRTPDTLLMGDTVAVTLTLRTTCIPVPLLMHVVLVADPSGAMRSADIRAMRAAMTRLVDQLNPKAHTGTYVGVIDVGEEARPLTMLIKDVDRLKAAIGRINREGDTRIDLGIQEASRMLRLARANLYPRAYPGEVIVVFSDGRCAAGCEEAMRAARQAKAEGLAIMAGCVGARCDTRCMRDIASGSRFFFRVETFDWFRTPWRNINLADRHLAIKHWVITQTLAADVAYVPGSADPPPLERDGGRTLVWSGYYLPEDGLTTTLRVRPLAAGRSHIASGVTAFVRDNQDQVYTATGPTLPPVTVLEPGPLPTPTRTP